MTREKQSRAMIGEGHFSVVSERRLAPPRSLGLLGRGIGKKQELDRAALYWRDSSLQE